MKNFKVMISIFMLAVSFASISAAKKSVVRKASGKKTAVKKVVKKEEEKSPVIGMSNPASVYCVEQGGELKRSQPKRKPNVRQSVHGKMSV